MLTTSQWLNTGSTHDTANTSYRMLDSQGLMNEPVKVTLMPNHTMTISSERSPQQGSGRWSKEHPTTLQLQYNDLSGKYQCSHWALIDNTDIYLCTRSAPAYASHFTMLAPWIAAHGNPQGPTARSIMLEDLRQMEEVINHTLENTLASHISDSNQ